MPNKTNFPFLVHVSRRPISSEPCPSDPARHAGGAGDLAGRAADVRGRPPQPGEALRQLVALLRDAERALPVATQERQPQGLRARVVPHGRTGEYRVNHQLGDYVLLRFSAFFPHAKPILPDLQLPNQNWADHGTMN